MRQVRTSLGVVAVLVLALGFGLVACSTTQTAGDQVDDAAITASVKSKFLADPDVAAINIDVDTNEGVVTLSGRVESQFQKDEAGRIARGTDGVRSVINNLSVGDKT
jgi:hyperosmotically inducible protein